MSKVQCCLLANGSQLFPFLFFSLAPYFTCNDSDPVQICLVLSWVTWVFLLLQFVRCRKDRVPCRPAASSQTQCSVQLMAQPINYSCLYWRFQQMTGHVSLSCHSLDQRPRLMLRSMPIVLQFGFSDALRPSPGRRRSWPIGLFRLAATNSMLVLFCCCNWSEELVLEERLSFGRFVWFVALSAPENQYIVRVWNVRIWCTI